jgi:hypothetical protein
MCPYHSQIKSQEIRWIVFSSGLPGLAVDGFDYFETKTGFIPILDCCSIVCPAAGVKGTKA